MTSDAGTTSAAAAMHFLTGLRSWAAAPLNVLGGRNVLTRTTTAPLPPLQGLVLGLCCCINVLGSSMASLMPQQDLRMLLLLPQAGLPALASRLDRWLHLLTFRTGIAGCLVNLDQM